MGGTETRKIYQYIKKKRLLIKRMVINMGAAKFPKGSTEWMLFVDFWEMCKKYWYMEDTEVYWEGLNNDVSNFIEKYGDYPFATKIGLAFMDYQEDQCRRRKNET